MAVGAQEGRLLACTSREAHVGGGSSAIRVGRGVEWAAVNGGGPVRNQYAGTCYRCGEMVEPGAGHFERWPGHGWRTQHASCARWFRGREKVHVVQLTEEEKAKFDKFRASFR